MNAFTLSVLRHTQEGLSEWTAATAMTLAAITHTLAKASFSGWFGGKTLITHVAPDMLTILLAGSSILFLYGMTDP